MANHPRLRESTQTPAPRAWPAHLPSATYPNRQDFRNRSQVIHNGFHKTRLPHKARSFGNAIAFDPDKPMPYTTARHLIIYAYV